MVQALSSVNEAQPFSWARVERVARERFGIDRFRRGQPELLHAVFQGRDVLGILPTGAGKSLCYQLPALFLPKPVVVVSPLISLMQDQQEKLTDVDVGSARVNSTLTESEEREAAADIREGEPEVVFVTPERLENAEYLTVLREGGVSLFVIDETRREFGLRRTAKKTRTVRPFAVPRFSSANMSYAGTR